MSDQDLLVFLIELDKSDLNVSKWEADFLASVDRRLSVSHSRRDRHFHSVCVWSDLMNKILYSATTADHSMMLFQQLTNRKGVNQGKHDVGVTV